MTTSQTTPAKKRKAPSKAAPKASAPKAAAKKKIFSTDILFTAEPIHGQEPTPPFIWVDYPQEGEKLLGPTYVIRLGIGGADSVEIAIDKGPWQPCRFTAGYWWYDWDNIAQGKHTLVARMKTSDGKTYRTPPRSCAFKP